MNPRPSFVALAGRRGRYGLSAALVALLLAGAPLWTGSPAWAAEPPPSEGSHDEADMFGGDEETPAPGPNESKPKPPPDAAGGAAGAAPDGAGRARSDGQGDGHGDSQGDRQGDDAPFGDERMRPMELEAAAKDRLQIGGMLYLRNGISLNDVDPMLGQPLTISNLTDVYLDARPSDRVRAFVRGRLLWTPTAVDNSSAGLLGFSTGNSALSSQLVELWLKFDLMRSIFVSVGAQQVRFGATRLWNPVDFLYATRRSPLTLFDQRTGLPMLKLHVPIESLGWNAYVLALSEGSSNLRGVGLVGRLEMVISTVEIGLMAKKRLGQDPRLGLDVSAGIWEVDVGAELGARRDASGAWHWMLSSKLEHTISYGDNDSIIWGIEGFYNPDGIATLDGELDVMEDYAKASAAHALAGGSAATAPVFPLQFFYTGRYYGALYAVAMGPGSWDDTSFTLSAIANFSDGSGTLRFDVGQTVLQHLRLEAYVSSNLGSDGEFRFYTSGLKKRLGPLLEAAGQDPDTVFKRPLAAFGLNLRMTL